jgi:ubiquinone/menaquinone biosynthesis C-methylase UbiE
VSDRFQQIQTRYRDPKVASRYDQSRYCDFQGRLNNRAAWRALSRALKHAQSGGTILDIPCGTGRFSRQLTENGFQVFASDISEEMLGVARKIEPSLHCFQGDIFRLPFHDQTFDAIVCIRFFNLVDRDKRVEAVREMARVARVVVASYYHKYTIKYAGRWLRHRLGLHKGNNPRLTRAGLMDEIRETGLHLHQVISVSPLLSEEWLVVMSRNGTDGNGR